MKSQQIFWLLGGAALFGWYFPGPSGGAEGGAGGNLSDMETGPGVSRNGSAARDMSRWDAGPTVLIRQQDGHFYANVLVDGGEYRFLVDTGASVVALTGEDAEAMGLDWDEASVRQIGKGASGAVYGVPVRIPRMEVGRLEARDVQAAIVPEGLGVSLLGQSFLSRISHVSINGDEMRLGG